MAKAGSKGARIRERGLARIAASIALGCTGVVCWTVPLVPAVWINLDAARSQGSTWAVFAIASVVFGAVCVENAIECRGVVKRALFAILATFFLCLNVFNALGNAAAHSEHGREDRASQIRAHARIEQQRSQWSQARKEQAVIAGSATPESIDADIQAAKAADATRWKATEGCNVEKITAGPSKAFCAAIAQLEAKKAAATKRDELEAKLAGLDSKDVGAVPESADPFADNLARMLGLLGYAVSDDGKVLIASLRDWGKAVGVELLAGFGPSGLLLILWRITSSSEQAPVPQRKAPAPAKEKTPAPAPEPELEPQRPALAIVEGDAEIDAFITGRLEFVAGEHIPAGQLFQAWKDDCAEHGREPGSAKGFSNRIRKRILHEPNSGRPRYVGVRFKATDSPRLRIVNG
jgi:hypothetical protein